MMKQITLPYGHEERTIEIPEANIAWIEGPRHAVEETSGQRPPGARHEPHERRRARQQVQRVGGAGLRQGLRRAHRRHLDQHV